MSRVVFVVVLALGLATSWRWARRGWRSASILDRVVGGVESRPVPGWFRRALTRAELEVDNRLAWRTTVTVAVLAGGLVVVGSPGLVPLVALGGAVGAAGLAVRSSRARPGRSMDPTGLVEALVGPLAGGASLAVAVDRVVDRGGTASGSLAGVHRAIAGGTGVQRALDDWADAAGDDRVALITDSIAVAGTSGGSLAAALLGAGRTIREREALERELRALVSQARTSAAVLVLVPIGFTALVALADHRVAAFLFTDPAGWACLAAGLLADGAGWWWMRHLIGSVR